MQRVSVHSTQVNYAISELYKIEHRKSLPRHLSSIGITHDIGKVIMLGYFAGRYEAVVAYGNDHSCTDFFRSEVDLGFEGATHAEIGAYFVDHWGLPQTSIEASLYHHDSEAHEGSESLAICRTANLLANYTSEEAVPGQETLPSFLGAYSGNIEFLSLAKKLREIWEEGFKGETG